MSFRDVHENFWLNMVYGRSPVFYVLIGIAIVVLVIVLLTWPSRITVFSTDPTESAWMACTSFVENKMRAPVSEAQAYDPAGVTHLSGDSYQVEVQYPNLSATYRCTVENVSEKIWELKKISKQ